RPVRLNFVTCHPEEVGNRPSGVPTLLPVSDNDIPCSSVACLSFFYPSTLLRSLHYGDSSYTTPLTNIFVAVPVPSMQLNSTTPAKAQISILPSLHSTPRSIIPTLPPPAFSEPGGVCPCQLVVAYHLIRQMLPT
ncbi:hypothetical protein CSPX01_11458, partial [Colletotrichum filicis]